MHIPDRSQYDQAIQYPRRFLKIDDPDLLEGAVEMVEIPTSKGVVRRPWGLQGGFAIVYKFRAASGRLRALRCFTVQMDDDIGERYQKVGPYFQAHAGEITVEFKYHDPGISVRISEAKFERYPVLEMGWIEGVNLIERLDELCQARDQVTIGRLADQWRDVVRTLRRAGIAHGDLAGANVMIRPDGRMVLIDYDGVFIPPFAGKDASVVGHPDYQHPEFGQRMFDEWMDDFSALVIYTALVALRAKPELWDEYTKRANGKILNDNLLFTERDFQPPWRSKLMLELEQIDDPDVSVAVRILKESCRLPLEAVRIPRAILDPDLAHRSTAG